MQYVRFLNNDRKEKLCSIHASVLVRFVRVKVEVFNIEEKFDSFRLVDVLILILQRFGTNKMF